MNRVISLRFMLLVVFLTFSTCFAVNQGILITPDANDHFEYADDFSTPKFLVDAFLNQVGADCWKPGSVFNWAPHNDRTLTYRFYSDRVITAIDLQVDQGATKNLGGRNTVYLSTNGVDWKTAANSDDLEPDSGNWRRGPLVVSDEQAAEFVGHSQLWVRLELENYSGGKGNPSHPSNYIDAIKIKLKVGEKSPPSAAPQQKERALWGQLHRQADWRVIKLDWIDPVDQRPPHYYEDCDGLFYQPDENHLLNPDETIGFPIQRAYSNITRLPLSLAVFVKTSKVRQPLMAQIIVHCTGNSSRQMNVFWDDLLLTTFDAASYFDEDKSFFVTIGAPVKAGIHQLRIAGADSRAILVRGIMIAGDKSVSWSDKPRLPKNKKLQVLSAYYMPDPKPFEGSQLVEGRHKARKIGMIFRPLQRFYKEHADFGAVRIVVRNNGKVPVQINNRLLLNGKPVEDSYVDFINGPWDARGVIWYRIRPRLLEPNQCAQIYIRFRRRPAGDHAAITINFENAKPVNLKIPYEDPGLSIDYVTTGKSLDTLYVYARRSAGSKPDKAVELNLDGKVLDKAKFYGSDFSTGVALAVAKLAQPLKVGQFHVVGIKTNSGKRVDAQFPVLPFKFVRSSVDVPLDKCKQMHMNTAMWHQRNLETCMKYDFDTSSKSRFRMFNLHRRVSILHGINEPDGKDDPKEGVRGPQGHARGLGRHARRLTKTGWHTLVERFAPHTATMTVVNGTSRPLNYTVYGQLSSLARTNHYVLNFYNADHAFVRECLLYFRTCSAPLRLIATMEAFGYREGEGVPKGGRGPIPAEYRQNVVQAIGAGMKGMTSWAAPHHLGGWRLNKPCEEEITKLNALIEHIEDELLIGTPVDIAHSDAGLVMTGVVGEEKWAKEKVWVSSLLCGPDTIILAAANHISASKPEPPTIEPARDVTITVQLPDFLTGVKVFEVTEDGFTPFDCTFADNKAVLKLASIESGRVFVLRRK